MIRRRHIKSPTTVSAENRRSRRGRPGRRRQSELIEPRNRELRALVKRIMRSDPACDRSEACRRAVGSQASRWWITEERAAQALGHWLAGERTQLPRAELTSRERMYADLAELYTERRRSEPELSYQQFARDTIAMPAPEYYLTAQSLERALWG